MNVILYIIPYVYIVHTWLTPIWWFLVLEEVVNSQMTDETEEHAEDALYRMERREKKIV